MYSGYFFVIVAVFWTYLLVQGINIETRKHCCNLGRNHSSNGFECDSFTPQMAGTSLANEKQCLNMVDACCKSRHREVQCNKGADDAKNGGTCSAGDEDRKECCEACQTGLDAGKAKEPCEGGLGLGPPYDDVFVSCCKVVTSKMASTTVTTSTITPTTHEAEIPDLFSNTEENSVYTNTENICESDVCAQLCEPAGNSYRCDCFKGYTLMEDGISCKPLKRALKKGGRCNINNPCDHDCTDTGTAIKCSCREGYELAEDNRTCKDIDECARDLHDCLTLDDCINEIGTYSCYEPSFPEENEDIDYDKKCPAGYKFNLEKQVCDDIDECQFDLTCIRPKICKNTIGSFICEGEDKPLCPPGFKYKDATGSCTDIDECLSGENDCNKESQFCVNSKGNYTCIDKASRNACPPGFKKNSLTQLCDDINECEVDSGICGKNEECVNESGGHTCIPIKGDRMQTTLNRPHQTTISVTTTTRKPISCPTGYSYSAEKNACADINECQMGKNQCGIAERCDNTIGSYHCSRIFGCGTGYTFNTANGLCEDDDECSLGSHNCKELGPNFRCRNTLGSYRCEAVRPKYNPVNSQIPQKPSTFSTSSKTVSTAIQRTTTLGVSDATLPVTYSNATPYYTTADKTYSETLHNYQTTPYVYHTPNYTHTYSGIIKPVTPPPIHTFRTDYPVTKVPQYSSIFFKPYPTTLPILPYYSKRTSPRPPPPVPTQYFPVISGQLKKCLPGYIMNNRGECEDINECGSNPCGRHEKCLNFNGRYVCAAPMQCPVGYELNDDGDQCIDVNECSRGTHKCNPSQICKNYQGYYTCECPPGHHLDRRTEQCEDIDECKMFRPCGFNSHCTNTIGSYRCDCKDGFYKTRNSCEDIDECSKQSGLCEHKCVNTWGSYRCSCSLGFTLNYDNRTCTDIDECDRFKDRRLCIGTCKNVPGSYVCECPEGYKLGSDGRICKDIDECAQNVCGTDEVCINTRGSYKCYMIKCPPNYIKDTQHKARCKRLPSFCDPRDYKCILMPEQYTYQYITLVSNLPLTQGHIQLFQIKGPNWFSSRAEFTMKLLEVICPYNVVGVDETFFQKANEHVNTMALYLVKPIQGPQEIKLQIEMQLYQGNVIVGNAVVYIIIIISEYPF